MSKLHSNQSGSNTANQKTRWVMIGISDSEMDNTATPQLTIRRNGKLDN